MVEAIKKKKGFISNEELFRALNADYFCDDVQIECHLEISDKFLIKIEKYLKILKQKYDQEKKLILSKSYLT